MRIAFVYDAIYPYVKGGGEKRIHELSRRLTAQGHTIEIYGMKWWDGPKTIEEDGVVLHGVCQKRSLYNADGTRSITTALYFAVHLILPLLRGSYDVIDCSAFPFFSVFSATCCSAVKRKPLVIVWFEVWGSYWGDYLGGVKGSIGKMIERVASKLGTHVISISGKTTSDLQNQLKVSPSSISTIPVGIDFSYINSISPSREAHRIVYAGRLIEHKHVDWLIKAMPEVCSTISDAKLVIDGFGPEEENLKKLVDDQKLGKSVVFQPTTEHDKTLEGIASSKILVLPSTREGQGIVVLEAMATGTSVIAVKHPASAVGDIIDHNENGILIPADDIKTLAQEIISLLTDAEKYASLTSAGLKTAKAFDWETAIVPKHLSVYAQVSSNQKSFKDS